MVQESVNITDSVEDEPDDKPPEGASDNIHQESGIKDTLITCKDSEFDSNLIKFILRIKSILKQAPCIRLVPNISEE